MTPGTPAARALGPVEGVSSDAAAIRLSLFPARLPRWKRPPIVGQDLLSLSIYLGVEVTLFR